MTIKVLLMQIGARHRYSIARILNERNLLAFFITDFNSISFMGKIHHFFQKSSLSNHSSKSGRMSRKIPVSDRKIISSDLSFFLTKFLNTNSFFLKFAIFIRDVLHLYVVRKVPLHSFDVFYSMNGENYLSLIYLKRHGKKIVVDVFIDPLALRKVALQKQLYSQPLTVHEEQHDVFERHYRKVYREADALLCPSLSVKNSLAKFMPEVAYKIHVSPYGSSLKTHCHANVARIRGKVFWAGSDWFRKGLHLLIDACQALKEEEPSIKIYIAGISENEIPRQFRRDYTVYLGKLNEQEMRYHYQTANLFALPSYAEGQAGVVLEAIAYGCPVIVSAESGIDSSPGPTLEYFRSFDSLSIAHDIRSFLKVCNLSSNNPSELRETYRDLFVSDEQWGNNMISLFEKVMGY